jgi:hypothetical protein
VNPSAGEGALIQRQILDYRDEQILCRSFKKERFDLLDETAKQVTSANTNNISSTAPSVIYDRLIAA